MINNRRIVSSLSQALQKIEFANPTLLQTQHKVLLQHWKGWWRSSCPPGGWKSFSGNVLDPVDLMVSRPNKDEVQSNIRIYSNPLNEDSIIQDVS